MLGQETAVLLLLCGGVLLLMAAVTNGAGFSLDGIKGRTVGDGQHGTARFAGKGEIRRTFHRVRFRPRAWRRGKHLPKVHPLWFSAPFPIGKLHMRLLLPEILAEV